MRARHVVARWLVAGLAPGAAALGGCPAAELEPAPSASATAAPPPPVGRRAAITDAPWEVVAGWIRAGDVSWVVPVEDGGAAFVRRRGGDEHATKVPDLATLTRLVEAADPGRARIGFTLHYLPHRIAPWSEVAALFPTGTVYEVEVSQGLRAFVTTIGGDGPGARLVTAVEDDAALDRLAATAPRPVIVKMFRVEELPWEDAARAVAAEGLKSASHVHGNRAFLGTASRRSLLTPPPAPDALARLVATHAPDLAITIE